ncbi:MAG TPA: M67 family metallopeptidase [Vicinamibacterales bacterium]|nr:M67 family metallopeptidase [Vicinamibacterales bacterium]
MSDGLRLGSGVLEAIQQHGRETYPHECCGALIGRDGEVASTVALPNITEEGPRRRFRVSDADYMKVERAASAANADLLGFYHSHPDHPARPSQYDLDHALPFFSYVIISVASGTPGDVRSWKLRDDRSAFDEEPLNLRPSSLVSRP